MQDHHFTHYRRKCPQERTFSAQWPPTTILQCTKRFFHRTFRRGKLSINCGGRQTTEKSTNSTWQRAWFGIQYEGRLSKNWQLKQEGLQVTARVSWRPTGKPWTLLSAAKLPLNSLSRHFVGRTLSMGMSWSDFLFFMRIHVILFFLSGLCCVSPHFQWFLRTNPPFPRG